MYSSSLFADFHIWCLRNRSLKTDNRLYHVFSGIPDQSQTTCPWLLSPVLISTREHKSLVTFQTTATGPCSGNCLIFIFFNFLFVCFFSYCGKNINTYLGNRSNSPLGTMEKDSCVIVRKLRNVWVKCRLLPQMQPYYKIYLQMKEIIYPERFLTVMWQHPGKLLI